MFKIVAGPGIIINTQQTYDFNGQPEIMVQVSIDTATKIDTYNIAGHGAQPGDVLTIDTYGCPAWQNPIRQFINDAPLINSNITVKAAWETLLKAVAEYEMTKKLVN